MEAAWQKIADIEDLQIKGLKEDRDAGEGTV
jgi:hypothetical protein